MRPECDRLPRRPDRARVQTFYYVFKYEPTNPEHPIPEMTGEDLKLNGTRADFQNGQPIVTLEFTDAGGEKFHEITRTLAQRGRSQTQFAGGGQDLFQHFAIVLDGEIRSWPPIDFNDHPDGISGNSALIRGSTRQARRKISPWCFRPARSR